MDIKRALRVIVCALIVCAVVTAWNPVVETVGAQARALLASNGGVGDISSGTTLMAIGSLQLAAVVAFEVWASRRRARPSRPRG